MSGSNTAGLPAFSYAQAAKGLAPSATPSLVTKDDTVAVEQLSKDSSTTDLAASALSANSSNKSGSEGAVGRNSSVTSSTKEHEKESLTNKRVQQNTESMNRSVSINSSPAIEPNQESTLSKQDGMSLPQTDRTDSWEKDSLVSTTLEKGVQSADKDKVKESEDDWEQVSVPSIAAAEKELKAAPIPTVNIWQQRREAQEAKLRETVTQRPTTQSASPPVSKTRSSQEDTRRKSRGRDQNAADKEPHSGQKKTTESARGSDRNQSQPISSSRPVSQIGQKSDSIPPPPVGDAVSWPTPETATYDDRRRSYTQEKSDKTDTKVNPQKSHGKQWVQMPFVPTAKFETQLPAGAARRGGRPSGRGRDTSGRGGHANQGAVSSEKHESGNPITRQPSESDRGRKTEGGRGTRATSLPDATRRPESDNSSLTSRKPSAPTSKDSAAVDGEQSNSITTEERPSVEESRVQPASKASSSSGQEPSTSTVALNGEGSESQAATVSTNEATFKPNTFERNRSTGTGRPNGDFNRGPPRRSESGRDKGESYRERETSGDQGARREPRPERGRGGYRGRGNHGFIPSFPGSHAFTSPLPQNGFDSPKQPSSAIEPRSRQSSQPFSMGPPPAPGRNTARSQSMAPNMMYPGYYHGMPGLPQALSPIQTDMSTYGFTSPMGMHPGIMSAMPFSDPLNSYALLSMLMTQVEYYFSIDNLCKDLFLRKNMDSQGFVPLSVIANFKRIKALTEDTVAIDILRYVCQQVKSVEYVPGENGDDRLRRRDGWRDFVLPMEERLPAARNDGPSVLSQMANMSSASEQIHSHGAAYTLDQMRSPSSEVIAMNGSYSAGPPQQYVATAFDAQQQEQAFVPRFSNNTYDQLPQDPTAPPFSPSASNPQSPPLANNPLSYQNMMNGHHRQKSQTEAEENIFPDESIPAINICVREPIQGSNPSEDAAATDDDVDDPSDTPSARVSGLRGGAGNPEHLEQIRGMTFGRASPQPFVNDGSVVFFTKDGQQTQPPPPQPGQYYQTYQSLHDIAVQQRDQGVDGALEPLYAFWSNFLVDKFNVGMYEEFKSMALGELGEGNDSGSKHLSRYYSQLLNNSLPMTDRIATDLVTLARQEKDSSRPVFHMIRLAWRNGATNLKTRKRLGDLLTIEEKTEFDL